jgi:hypothetical protein
MNDRDNSHDDLTAIKGIGLARQKWFGDALGVYTYEQLAALLVDEVEAKLKSDGKIPSRSEIETWISQAQTLATEAAKKAPGEPLLGEDGVKAELNDESSLDLAVPEANETVTLAGTETWKPFASFVVEYQSRVGTDQTIERRTVVHYMEADINATWPEFEKDQLCQWMERQARVSEPPMQVVQSAITDAPAIRLRATQVRLMQPPNHVATIDVNEVNRPFIAHIRHDKPISLEVAFEVSPAGKVDLIPFQIDYTVHCHMHNLTTGLFTQLVAMTTDPPAGSQPAYKALLCDFSLKPGMYDLAVLVRSKNPLGIDYYKLPKLNVL